MAEVVQDEQNVYDTPEGIVVEEKKVVAADLDTFARIIQEKFQQAREYRRDHEQHCQEAYDAYRAKYPATSTRQTSWRTNGASSLIRPGVKSIAPKSR